MRSGVVLAGGGSTRFDDGDKAVAMLRDRPLVLHVVDAVSGAVDEVVVVARDDDQMDELSFLDAEIVTDSVKGYGPVAGLEAGFGAANGESCFVTACDTPLLRSEVVELLFEAAEGYGGAVPSNDYLEPLMAVYDRAPMLEAAGNAIERGAHRIIELYEDLGPINMVPKEEFREVDPEFDSFLNVNMVEELERAKERLEVIVNG